MSYFGGGRVSMLTVRTGDQSVRVRARCGLFGMRDFGVVLEPPQYAGAIVTTHWYDDSAKANEESIRRSKRRLQYEVVTSLYAAFRQTHWILMGTYGQDLTTGEKGLLRQAMAQTRNLHRMLLGIIPGTSVEQTRELIEATLTELLQTIGRPRAASKRQAQDKLEQLARGADSRGRANPSALAARGVSVHNLLQRRLEDEVMRIDPYIAKRRAIYLQAIHTAELRIQWVREFVEPLMRPGYLKKIVREAESQTRRALGGQCYVYAHQLEDIVCNPYRRACALTAHDLERVGKLLLHRRDERQSDDNAEIRQCLTRIKGALDLKYIQLLVERLIFLMSRQLMGGVRFNQARAAVAVGEIVALFKKLGPIDFYDGSFQQALPHLQQAQALLCQPQLEAVSEAREALKSASAVL